MLKSINLDRRMVYIANILKCRPPNNRDPKPEETQSCTPFLQQQIMKIQPKLIVAVGRIAAQYLLQTKTPIGRLRNKLHHFQVNHNGIYSQQKSIDSQQKSIPLIVTYHPAYLLRSPKEKAQAYLDLLEIKKYTLCQ